MFEKSRDEWAAVREYESILGKAHMKEHLPIFLKEFLKEYHESKKMSVVNLTSQMIARLQGSAFVLSNYNQANNLEKEAAVLGKSLGNLIGVVEFGIASEHWRVEQEQDILILFRTIANQLHSMEKQLSKKSLQKFIALLAKKKGTKISREQQKLIAEIAGFFS